MKEKYMTDKEILDKYIDLDKSCLMDTEKKQVMDMIYRYRDAFSLRDEIGTCLNIEVEIDITDKSPLFIRPYHAKEDNKNFIDREMKRLCHSGTVKGKFSAYSSPVMLIIGNVKDKRAVTDFKHLNVRIAKNNLAYLLLKHTFSVLDNSHCEVLSVFDLKDAFHSLRLPENLKDIVEYYHTLAVLHILYQRMPMGLYVSPSFGSHISMQF